MPDPVNLTEIVDLYLARCRVEGKSPRTTLAYTETLGRFLRSFGAAGAPDHIDAVSTADIIRYCDGHAHLSLGTRHRYFREVRCFFNWCIEAGLLDASPFRGLKNVRLPQRIVAPYSAADIRQLLGHCDAEQPVGARDRAVVLTLLDTGVRCSELVSFDLADWDSEAGRLLVRSGKGNKQRVVSFARGCAEALLAYLEHRGFAPGPLFLASNGSRRLQPGVRLNTGGLGRLLHRLGDRAGVPRVHPHRFRHTFATWAIEQDAREIDVQHLLGHAGPEMVRRYTSSYRSEQAAQRHVNFSPTEHALRAVADP